jgi:hypothetical protein
MKAINEGNGSFGRLAVTLTRAIIVAGCFFWAANTFAQTLSVQSDATQPAQPDSIVQLTADAQGLPLLSPDAVPASGTFWLVMPGIDGGVTAPMPCPPKDSSLPIYQIANGQFLVDATGGQVAVSPGFAGRRIAATTVTDALEQEATSVVNLITRIQTSEADQQTRATMQAMGMDVPSPGDGGTNSFTPDGASYIAPSYGTNLWIAQVTVLSGNLNGIGTNTQADIQYDIFSRTNLLQTDWQFEGSIYGSETTNWTPLTVSQNGRPILFLRLRSDADDGSGLPLWWQLQYFGTTGVDPNGDPAGDGWSNLQKFQNGMDPNVFYTPLPPPGFSVAYNSQAGTVALKWQPSQGNVTGYTVTRYDPNTYSQTTVTLSSNATSYTDSSPITSFPPEYGVPTYTLQGNYALGNSGGETLSMFDPNTTVASQIVVGGSGGRNLLLTSPVPAGTTTLRVIRSYSDDYWDYTTEAFNMPISDLNGNAVFLADNLFGELDDSDSAYEDWYVQTVNANGDVSNPTQAGSQDWYYGGAYPPPFLDGRQQLAQNANFIFRAADASPLFYAYIITFDYPNSIGYWYIYPQNYSYAGLYDVTDIGDVFNNSGPYLDKYRPFIENYFFRNFAFGTTNIDSSTGMLNTGLTTFNFWGFDYPTFLSTPTFVFQQTTNTAIPALLDTSSAQWLTFYPQSENDGFPDIIGLTGSGGNYAFTNYNGTTNVYGLPYNSVKFAYNNGSLQTPVLSRGGTISGVGNGGVFWNTTAPQLQTVDYYFSQPGFDPLPGDGSFTTDTTTSPGLVAGFGSSTVFAGYAKQRLLNGYTNVFSYLGQYFDKAYQIDGNGNVTTNSAGAISPYGELVANAVGPVALVTMTNWGENVHGTGVVQVVKLVLDVNHDGIMDTSVSGPDNTSASSPYVFWSDQNFDRFVLDSDDNVFYDDDVAISSPAANSLYTGKPTPDCNYQDGGGNRVIPCARDLQDFTRLWVCGITTNLLTNLPPGSIVSLSWGDVAYPNPGNPTIDLFVAADPDGGTGYLTNSTTASAQLDSLSYPCIGRLGPGGSIPLNSYDGSGNLIWLGSHFIWCGVSNGTGGLTLTIADGNGNTIAQTTTYIQIVDIKNLYERWTVGEKPGQTPMSAPIIAKNDLPDPTQLPFQYTSPQDTNTPYILYVHGWNMETWEKDRFAESAFKRLYWQGYQGRFGVFRWPTGFGFTGSFWQALTDPRNFDNSEYTAWQSAAGLLNLMTNLNVEYPGHVYVLAHSMGNVVTGEALRLAAQQGLGQIVNTYVASQGALPAHDYDATVTSPYLLQFSYWYPSGPLWLAGTVNYGPSTPNIYGNWLTTNAAAAGRRINFYNQNDFALAMPRWGFDQITKPDYIPPNNYYYYNGSVNDPAPWNKFYDSPIVGDTGVLVDIVTNLNNHYEIMAYAAEPRSTALGATPGISTITRNLDLTTIWPADTSGHNYADHLWHSAEFRGDYWQEQGYWNDLLFSSQYGFNIGNQ